MRLVLKTDDRPWRSAYIPHVSLVRRLMGSARSLDPRLLDAGLALGLTIWVLAEPGAWSGPGQAFVLVVMTVAVA